MEATVIELYPASGTRKPLKGLYLSQMLETGKLHESPFIYSNFISSLDGRIALPGPGRNSHQVPPAIANKRDWRLFQELAAQADLLITSARYFRQSEDQEAQAELPVGSSAEFDDLRAWRIERGLSPQPDIAFFSASLDVPVNAINRYQGRNVYLITGSAADPGKLGRITAASHAQVISCGNDGHVDASLLRNRLRELGYRRVYAIAGSAVLHTLLEGNALDRLYHTTAHCLLGGTRFDTFVRGSEFKPAVCMPLRAMYLDTHAPDGASQTLAVYG
ncbi:MAG: dihydrofolate reductase family protein [Thiogranum sp.]